MDERQKVNQLKAWSLMGKASLVIFLGQMIREMVQNRMVEAVFSMLAILILWLLMTLSLYLNQEYKLPLTLNGKPLPLGKSKTDKRQRMLRCYLSQAIITTLGLALGTFLSRAQHQLAYGRNDIILSIFVLIILFFVYSRWGEQNITKYHNLCQEEDP